MWLNNLKCLISGQSLLELAKDKIMNKSVENPAKDFLKTLEDIEVKLANHIVYLTQISTGLYVYFEK